MRTHRQNRSTDRQVRHLGWFVAAMLASIILVGCTTGSSGSSGPGDTGPNQSAAAGGGSAGGAATAGGGAGGGGAASIDACSLLTPAEMQQILGAAMGAGQPGNADDQASCDWDSDGPALGIIVQEYDDTLWSTLSGMGTASPVSGIGEKAYKGVPHQGDLSIKQGDYEIDVGVVDFQMTDEQSDAAALALAKLILPRVAGG